MAQADVAVSTVAHTDAAPLGFAMIVAAAAAAVALPVGPAVFATVVFGTFGLALLQRRSTGRWPSTTEGLLDAGLLLLLSIARDDGLRVWQIPDQWSQVFRLTAPGVALMVLIYGLTAAASLLRGRRHLGVSEVLGVLLAPILFSLLLLVGSDVLMTRLGFWMTGETAVDDRWRGVIGRAAILVVFVEALIIALRALVAHRLPRDTRMHLVLIGSALHAALSPAIADLTQQTTGLPAVLQIPLAVASAALAQAGLWALTFVVTGLAIDALSNRPPTFAVTYRHWSSGLIKGAIYGGVFMALILVAGAVTALPTVQALVDIAPLLVGFVAGTALFPLVATIVASADGTAPFFGRLREAYATPRTYARGAVIGVGIAVALTTNFPNEEGGMRFLLAFLVGALAYGGVDFVLDSVERMCAAPGRWAKAGASQEAGRRAVHQRG